ncbi:M28 family peptidase [Conexibacter sp. DBS9H8]|uniref:M28 family peptidase n=1 Tax=Conexibacter sp. DBS9H8 TaxID=2937801 RepID=UPI00200C3DA7|nr:M28 family peptidase [Conexibacter sp. DBS9H8]
MPEPPTTSAPSAPHPRDWLDATGAPVAVPASVRELLEHLASLPRAPGSPGEAEAAQLFADRLATAGADVEVESAIFQEGYAGPIGALCGLATLTGLLGRRGRRRRLSTAVAALAAVGIADDVSNGARFVRGLRAPRATQNVVARIGAPEAERTLVILAHHDAAPTGRVFDDRAQHWAGQRFTGIIERMDTGLPLWWAVLAGPLLTLAGLLSGRRRLITFGTILSALDTAAFADIATSPTVPGANDNLSALAVQLALAERLRAEPVAGLSVLLVSCGAEEVIQGGIYSFAARHFPTLDRSRTWVLNLDTVGSPELVLLEGEGAIVMEDYHHRPFRDLVCRVADTAGAPIRRGLRARNSTDAVIASRAGYPTATLVSVDRFKALSNYHQLSDTAANVHWRTVAHAVLVCEQVARELAANLWLS